jgi:phosphinothricin acetyltransferase
MLKKINVTKIIIRNAKIVDMSAIQKIYAYNVLKGFASFEEVPPDLKEISNRREMLIAHGYPYRVAEIAGVIKGFAYAGPFRSRSAYLYTVENSIYVSRESQRQGIGQCLLEDLIECCDESGYRQMISIIGDSENYSSIALHAKLGFNKIGVQPSVGFKFGRWVDSVIMQRAIGKGSKTLPAEKKNKVF